MKDLTKLFLSLILLFSVLWIISFTVPKIIELYKTDNIEIKTDTIKTDTVLTDKRDTLYLTPKKPYVEIRYKTVTDTLLTEKHDTVLVEVPLSVQKYQGDTLSSNGVKVQYRANVTGYRASLDSLWFAVERQDTTIYKEITVTKWKKNGGFRIVPYVGVGYNPIDKNIAPTIGVGVAYVF